MSRTEVPILSQILNFFRANLPAAERAQIEQTVVRVCAHGHSSVVYYARRDQLEPTCPMCGRIWRKPDGSPEADV